MRERESWVMFNKYHGQSCCTVCLSQCCMFTKHLTEVNLVKWDCTTQCVCVVGYGSVCCFTVCGKKLVDSEKCV